MRMKTFLAIVFVLCCSALNNVMVNTLGIGFTPSQWGANSFLSPIPTTVEAVGFTNMGYYVRNDGSDSNCSGLFDAPDPGSGGLPRPCAFALPQTAVNAAACGDTIYLKAGHTWTTAGQFATVLTINKACSAGSPLTIKSTLADTIAQARPATLIPSGTTLANMANLLSVGGLGGGFGPIIVQSPASYIVLDGLHLTTTGAGDNSTNNLINAESGNHITIQRSYFHPPETSTVDWERSAERAVAAWPRPGPPARAEPGAAPARAQ